MMSAKTKWEYVEEQLSEGIAYSVYDEGGDKLTMPYIGEKAARLIAAAPELLVALKAAYRALVNERGDDLAPPRIMNQITDAIDAATA